MRIPLPPRRGNSILLVSLVDVLFVLLLFFLLASKSLAPPMVTVALQPAAVDPPSWTLVLDGRGMSLNGQALELPVAVARLQAEAAAAVRVKAGEDVSLKALLPALEGLRAAGIMPLLDAPS